MSAATTLAAYEAQRDALLAKMASSPSEYRTGRRSVDWRDMEKRLAQLELQIDKYTRLAARESSSPFHLARPGRAS